MVKDHKKYAFFRHPILSFYGAGLVLQHLISSGMKNGLAKPGDVFLTPLSSNAGTVGSPRTNCVNTYGKYPG